MNQAILMSIRPEWVVLILNLIKTMEIRKFFPKDYVGWVYMYCTKSNKYLGRKSLITYPRWFIFNKSNKFGGDVCEYNGKVVARFWCDKVIPSSWTNCLKGSCLSYEEVKEYTKGKDFVGIHISKLEVFDRPKELNEFITPTNLRKYKKDLETARQEDYELFEKYGGEFPDDVCANGEELTKLTYELYCIQKAPQNYCYVEIGE